MTDNGLIEQLTDPVNLNDIFLRDRPLANGIIFLAKDAIGPVRNLFLGVSLHPCAQPEEIVGSSKNTAQLVGKIGLHRIDSFARFKTILKPAQELPKTDPVDHLPIVQQRNGLFVYSRRVTPAIVRDRTAAETETGDTEPIEDWEVTLRAAIEKHYPPKAALKLTLRDETAKYMLTLLDQYSEIDPPVETFPLPYKFWKLK